VWGTVRVRWACGKVEEVRYFNPFAPGTKVWNNSNYCPRRLELQGKGKQCKWLHLFDSNLAFLKKGSAPKGMGSEYYACPGKVLK